MADLQTVTERADLEKVAIAYVGDGNNVANSLLNAVAVLGGELRIATPATHQPAAQVRKRAAALAAQSGARLAFTADPVEAVRGADFVYTDVWTSMGQEAEAERRRALFEPFQVNARLMRHAPHAQVMHCLPAHRGEEITDDVLDGDRSIVFDQAENRLHAQKAILEALLATPSA
jgi:ornithine carbamoyltransferase